MRADRKFSLGDLYFCLIAFSIMALIALGAGFLGERGQSHYEKRLTETPCAEYANTRLQDIPGRCVAYWNSQDAGK